MDLETTLVIVGLCILGGTYFFAKVGKHLHWCDQEIERMLK